MLIIVTNSADGIYKDVLRYRKIFSKYETWQENDVHTYELLRQKFGFSIT